MNALVCVLCHKIHFCTIHWVYPVP
jgi:hypothetical protein